MSFASVKSVTSNGDLGTSAITTAFADTPLVSGVASVVSNTISLEYGVWALNARLLFTTNADDTTTITSLLLTTYNEIGQINQETLIWNGVDAGAYIGGTQIYQYTNVVTAYSDALNEFVASVTWTGAGSAPSANVILSAIKLV
jgi:hypothetical protein